ncbi:MAG: DUF2461 domain-containing protein [Planctomycetota bacterium]|nr:DUF2461 domain-containing protein [Planctomycetota bacterium]
MAFQGFTSDLARFLEELDKNNNKPWFEQNKGRFQENVQGPLLDFLLEITPKVRALSPHILVEPKPAGGSLMRVYRDVRFSKDKSPYNTHMSFVLRHEEGKKSPAPGFFFRVDTQAVHLGAGVWHPEKEALAAIREAIVADPRAWKRARDNKKFRERYGELAGESLKRPPKGFDPEHALVEDLKRKDLVGFHTLPLSSLTKPTILGEVVDSYKVAKPLMVFLTGAMGLAY